MKTRALLSIAMVVIMLGAFAQKPSITLTFTADNNGQHVPLNSILIENLTKSGDTTLYAPDTILVLSYVLGIGEDETFGANVFKLFQNFPNPMKGQTTVTLFLPEREEVLITISNIVGRDIFSIDYPLDYGNHSFSFYPGRESLYFFTARIDQQSRTIKMFNSPGYVSVTELCKLEYNGTKTGTGGYKAGVMLNNFVFDHGDQIQYTASSGLGDRAIIATPSGDQTYIFQYGSGGMPCPSIPTVTYEGQVYNTVLIGSQCYLKENLNVGTMINGSQNQTNNGTIEKYCYNGDPANCGTYGGLYQWDEMMGYSTTPGVQGICPPGWHIPTDEEWKELEGAVDSQYGYPDPEWNGTGWRGFDAGLNLKSTTGWNSGGNSTDLYGFGALPGSYRHTNGSFNGLGNYGTWWSSSERSGTNAWSRDLYYEYDGSRRRDYNKTYGRSVRCLKDN